MKVGEKRPPYRAENRPKTRRIIATCRAATTALSPGPFPVSSWVSSVDRRFWVCGQLVLPTVKRGTDAAGGPSCNLAFLPLRRAPYNRHVWAGTGYGGPRSRDRPPFFITGAVRVGVQARRPPRAVRGGQDQPGVVRRHGDPRPTRRVPG